MFSRISKKDRELFAEKLSALGLGGARLMHGMAWLAGEDEGSARGSGR